ncbi:MAG: LysM peptidoglycan-binding domain-containing protein [Acidobacteria bacterium]|nr:LysM peptidoglycan-binding domain-containing protein [Acidobacteriota bacterium]
MVGNHWTPYVPPDPESFPAGSQVHIIEPHDTLWDLSAKYLTNAWLWPQLWDVNQYITDSHWIYPGDPLLLPGAPTVIGEAPAQPAPVATAETPAPAAAAAQEEFEEPPPEVPAAPAAPAMPPPPALPPLASSSEIYCSTRILPSFEKPPLFVAEKEEGAKTVLSNGDIIFLSQGSQAGIQPGQIFSVVRNEHEVYHPMHPDERLGTAVRSIGRVRIIAVQTDAATAEIVNACDAVGVGDSLVPFQEVPVPLSSPVAFQQYGVEIKGENDGYIIHVADDKASFGQGDIVNINLGSDNGVQSGDLFTVFREWGGAVNFYAPEMYIDGQQARAEKMKETGAQPQFSQIVLGQLVVLGIEDKTATAKVLVAVREMSVGDKVELR